MKKIVNIEVSHDGQRIDRDYVVVDGTFPEDMDLQVQDMLDTLLDDTLDAIRYKIICK